MNEENAQVIYDLLDRIKVTDENRWKKSENSLVKVSFKRL